MIETRTLEIALVLLRLVGFMVFFPVLGDGRLPRVVKLGFGLSLSWLLLADSHRDLMLAEGLSAENLDWVQAISICAAEMLFGAGLGFAFGILIEPARIAGSFIGQELGLTMATATDPSTRVTSNVVSQIFEAWTVILFFSLNVHHVLLRVVKISLIEFPIGQGLLNFPAPAAAYEVDLASKWGLLIASPIGICLFLTIVALGLLMRAVPSMNIFSIGLGARICVGLTAMIVFLPVMTQMLVRVLGHADDVVAVLFSR